MRALAVIAVIFYHAGFTIFAGGFVGVDVFFAISGFLITSIIVQDVEAGKFSFANFYERRARRILPALFFVVACCVPFAWVLLYPPELKAFAASVVSVCLFGSNILFLLQSGYFDTASALKPLLHTWSLSVEEQYYILFPIAVIFLQRFGRNRMIITLVVVAAASLVLSEYGWRHKPMANFYLLPTRAWELLCGALCSFVPQRFNTKYDNLLSGLGLIAVLSSVFWFTSTTPFPSVFSVLPVGGACLLLVYATEGTVAQRLLSARLSVGVGLVSYSTYLWHQPIFAFSRQFSVEELGSIALLVLSAVSLLMGYLSWRFIELPWRKKSMSAFFSRTSLVLCSIACSVSLILFGLIGYKNLGFPTRFAGDPDAVAFLNHYDYSRPNWPFFSTEKIMEKYADQCNFFNTENYRTGLSIDEPKGQIPPSCYERSASAETVVFIWGDSHAQMLRYGLDNSLPKSFQILQVASSGCGPSLDYSGQSKLCARSNSFAFEAIQKNIPDVVIIAQVDKHDSVKISELANKLLALGVKRVIATGPTPQWQHDLPQIILKHYWKKKIERSFVGLKLEILNADKQLKSKLGGMVGLVYVSLTDTFCNESGCLLHLNGDEMRGLVSWDYGHLVPSASLYLAQHILTDAITHGF